LSSSNPLHMRFNSFSLLKSGKVHPVLLFHFSYLFSVIVEFLFGLIMHKPLQSFLIIFVQACFYHITDRFKDFSWDFYIINNIAQNNVDYKAFCIKSCAGERV